MKPTDRLSLTRKPDRRKIADLIAAELAKVAGAAVTVTPEGDVYGKRRRVVAAVVNGVRLFMDCDGALPDFILAGWHFVNLSGDDRRLAARFGSMIGGSVNPVHGHKATGPSIGADRLGFTGEREAFEVRDLLTFATIARMALQDVADGGAFEPAKVAA